MAFVAPLVSGFATSISGASVCQSRAVSRSRSNVVTMKVSQAMPFMEVPEALEDESIPGNVGFDPLNLSGTFDLKFMQEAEIKHCRVAMLGVLGYVFPEFWRFPGVNPMSATEAHNFFVNLGSMSQILLWCSFLEIFGTVALAYTMNGGDRAPGDFKFDPLGLGKDPAKLAQYQLAELKNGRLAMCAFGGLYHANLVSKQGVIEQLTHFKGIPGHTY